VIELVIIGGQRPAILKVNAAANDIAHFHQFAIGSSEGSVATIARQEQLVAGILFSHRIIHQYPPQGVGVNPFVETVFYCYTGSIVDSEPFT
jgi:hypothetical protein